MIKRVAMVLLLSIVSGVVFSGEKPHVAKISKRKDDVVAYHGKGGQHVLANSHDKMAMNAAQQIALAMNRQFSK